MLEIRYTKSTYGPKCQNTHGPNLKALAPAHMGMGPWPWAHGPWAAGGWGEAAAQGQGQGPPPPTPTPHAAAGPTPMPMCPGAKALAHEYFDIWAHKYF